MTKILNGNTALLLKYDVMRDYFMEVVALWKDFKHFFRASGYVGGVTLRARFLTSNG